MAIDLTKPTGRVLGVDLIPAQPPRGVSTIQGDFLSPDVQASIRAFLRDPDRGRSLRPQVYSDREAENAGEVAIDAEMTRGYIDREREGSISLAVEADGREGEMIPEERTVDVVLSDMCEPWEQTTGFFNRTLSNPYFRMMNTSGNNFRDHAGSMVSFVLLSQRTLETVLMISISGSMPVSSPLQLRHPQSRRTLRLQILPRRRRQGTGEIAEGSLPQGASREAGKLEKRAREPHLLVERVLMRVPGIERIIFCRYQTTCES